MTRGGEEGGEGGWEARRAGAREGGCERQGELTTPGTQGRAHNTRLIARTFICSSSSMLQLILSAAFMADSRRLRWMNTVN